MKTVINILIYLILFNVQALSQRHLFQNLTVQDGLSDGDVNYIIQDRKGFLWIATEGGLNRYDGYEFKIFKYNQNDPNSLPNNSIWALYEDKSGYIWIGTKNGDLVRFSPSDEKFTTIKINDLETTGNSITSIQEDKNGDIWFGTYSKGLFRYNLSTGKITNWHYEKDKPNSLSNNYVTFLIFDNYGGLWISTYNGLNYLNPDKDENKITVYKKNNNGNNSINDNLVWTITQSKYDNDLLYIVTEGCLSTYNLITKKFESINFKIEYPSKFSNSVGSVVEDRSNGKNTLWIATYGGIYQLDLISGKSKQYIADKKNISGLLTNQIDQLMFDKSGVLWLVTDKGLNFLPATTKKINYIFSEYLSQQLVQDLFSADIKAVLSIDSETTILGTDDGMFSVIIDNNEVRVSKIDQLNNFNIWSLEKGNDNSIWIGTYGKGLFNYNLKTKTLKKYSIVSPTFQTSAYEYIKALRLSKDGTLWIGLWGGGIVALNTSTGKYKIWINDKNQQNSLNYNDVWYIHLDKFERVWIATNGGGLDLFVPKNNGQFLHWISSADDKSTLLNNSVQCIAERETDNPDETVLYIGTDVGLNKMVIKNRDNDIYNFEVSFSNLSNNIDLKDVSVKSIVADFKELWISTNKGIYQYNPDSNELLNYGISDGCGSVIFNSGAAARMINKDIVFGSVKGPSFFNPENIKQSNYEPDIVFTDLLIFNKSVSLKENTILDSSFPYSKEIVLANYENAITFKFSSLDFNSKENVKYAYKLEGFDKDWNYTNISNIAVYTNLDPGRYVFKVKGTNSDGRWGKNVTERKVIINNPWWRTGWAYAIFIIVILYILYLIRKFEINRTRLRNELRNLEFEAKKQKEIETLKSRFFANISHEFRTPLMLIKGPLEQLLLKKGNVDDLTRLAYSNTEKLKSLIDQLLDLSKLESNLITLDTSLEDISVLVKGLVNSFKSITDRKEISLTIDCPEEEFMAYVDLDKFEKILNNLLSNAYNFTSPKGSITVILKKILSDEKVFYYLVVKDNVIGI
ncbi:MAG: two-component regulator propeller domain-containing protein, partial [Ignavibacteriaceae bacterium]|nr:two-component regulator propeller domain-containing protein [Ignavibacteriaceae bacterium]